MKILYATSAQYPSPYANRIQILSTAEALRRRLGDLFVLAGNQFGENPFYKGRVVEGFTRAGIVLAYKQLAFARKEKIDTVYSREIGLLFLLMLGNTLFRLPLRFVYEAHDMDYSWRARFVLSRVAYVFCLTTPLKEDLESTFPKLRATVLPDAVDIGVLTPSETREAARKRLSLPLERKVALYIGDIDKWKGVETLLGAAELLPENLLVAFIGGRDWQVPELSRVNPKVAFLGPRPYEELANNMAAADVLILPNTGKEPISARYTSPLKLFAYMTSGRPIIASDLPSLRDVLSEKNAFLVPPDEPRALSRAIQEAVDNPVQAADHAEAARRDVQTYSWDKRAERILATLAP